MIIAAVFWVIGAVAVALFVGRAWSLGPLRAKTRGQLVRSGVDAILVLAIFRALLPPPVWASWLWVLAAVAVGVGVAGVILHWRRSTDERLWPTVIYAAVGAGLLVLLA